MADRPKISEADRKEIQNRINESLDYILNGQGRIGPMEDRSHLEKSSRIYELTD